MRYEQHYHDETFAVRSGSIYRLACCDCGLVHDFIFVSGRGKVYVKARRNNRATAQKRRWNGKS